MTAPTIDSAGIGPIFDLPRRQVLRALGLVRQGKVIDPVAVV